MENSLKKLQFVISEMDCAEEAAALKKVLLPLDGITEEGLRFDFLNRKLTVLVPESTGLEAPDIQREIRKTGMNSVSWEVYCNTGRCAVEEGYWKRKGRLTLCAASGFLLIAGLLSHALPESFAIAFIDRAAGWSGYPAASIILYIFAVITGGWYIFPKAVHAARSFRPDMNLLMITAVTGALIIGELFEAAVVSFLFALALLLESWSIGRARKAIGSLVGQSPETARIISSEGAEITEIPVDNVPVGSKVVIRPGEKIPLDGFVIKGSSYVDQSPITGESKPVIKEPNDQVFAGCVNGDGILVFQTTKPASDTTLARIIHMVEEAQHRRAPSERFVERFAHYYTPAMMLLAVLIAIVPPIAFGGDWLRWFYDALVILVIGCPCALVISTPVSIVAALTTAARHGVLVKGGIYMEIPGRLKAIAIDKTGTLTRGEPAVKEVLPVDGHTAEDILSKAASLEAHSTHPIARAVLDKAIENEITIKPAENYSIIQGKGAEGTINGKPFWIGSHRFLHEKDLTDHREFHEKANLLEEEGQTVVAVGTGDHVCGLISVEDRIRDESAEIVRELKKTGIKRVVMLTGDNEGTASKVAKEVQVDEFRAQLLPENKVEIVKDLLDKYGYTAMIGDGVNDAPALAVSSLGIAMAAAGSDAAIETADIALMSDDLSKLPWLIKHSKRTLSIIKQNIFFALGLKLAFIIMATSGVATLWMAIAADMGASLAVIFNSLRLLNGKN